MLLGSVLRKPCLNKTYIRFIGQSTRNYELKSTENAQKSSPANNSSTSLNVSSSVIGKYFFILKLNK